VTSWPGIWLQILAGTWTPPSPIRPEAVNLPALRLMIILILAAAVTAVASVACVVTWRLTGDHAWRHATWLLVWVTWAITAAEIGVIALYKNCRRLR
jgi:hypothetical protein